MLRFDKISNILELCKKNGAGFELHYCESDYTWYFVIDSPAPDESYIGKNRRLFDDAVEDAIIFFNKLELKNK